MSSNAGGLWRIAERMECVCETIQTHLKSQRDGMPKLFIYKGVEVKARSVSKAKALYLCVDRGAKACFQASLTVIEWHR